MTPKFQIEFNHPSTRKFFNQALEELVEWGAPPAWAVDFLSEVYLISIFDETEPKEKNESN